MKSSAHATPAAASTSSRRRARAAVGDVGGDRVGEEEALPERCADLAPQRVQRDAADVVPVDQHLTPVGVEQPLDQADDRRLAAAARSPTRATRSPARDVEVEPAQHLFLVVPEVHVAELDLAGELGQLDRVGRVLDRGLEVEHLEDPLHAGAGLLADGEDARRAGGRGRRTG